MFKTLISAIVTFFFLIGCSSMDKPMSIDSTAKGNFSCTVDMQSAPKEVYRIDGYISKYGLGALRDSSYSDSTYRIDTIPFSFINQGNYAVAYVNNLDPAYYYAVINAYDIHNQVVYTGSTGISVQSNQTSYANIRLGPAKGNISFYVTWDTIPYDTLFPPPDSDTVAYPDTTINPDTLPNDSIHFYSIDTTFTNKSWQPTNIHCIPGDYLRISSYDFWTTRSTPKKFIGPDGDTLQLATSKDPLPGAPKKALIGKIGENGTPFLVGTFYNDIISHEGSLYLCINQQAGTNNRLLASNAGFLESAITLARK